MSGFCVAGEMLASLWRLGDGEYVSFRNDGRVDAALEALAPDVACFQTLCWSETSLGRRCLDLPTLLDTMVWMELLELDGASFDRARVTLAEGRARLIVVGSGMSTADGRTLGRRLVELAVGS